MAEREPCYRRSPFLLLQWEGADLVLVNCNSLQRFRVDYGLLAVMARLESWISHEAMVASDVGVSVEGLDRLVELGVVEQDGSEDGGGDPVHWDPVDLLAQRRLNVGGSREDEGGLKGSPPSCTKERPSGRVVSLPFPGTLPTPLEEVIRCRRSVRTYGLDSLLLRDLSTVLFHSARVTRSVSDGAFGDQAFRPFPGAGARSELEIYVVANQVESLEPGAYWYDARSHDLTLLRRRDERQVVLNRRLNESTGGALNREPQAVLIITAVFARVMWKYHNIALTLIHQDTGCLYQTLYLTTTALGLAPCAIGAGPELENAHWLGLDPLRESQVGCFLLGTRGDLASLGGRVARMSAVVRIPTALRTLTSGQSEVTVEGSTIREILDSLDAQHPGFKGRLLDEHGSLQRFVNVFVAEEDVRFQEGMDTHVPAGCTVSIIPAVAGG